LQLMTKIRLSSFSRDARVMRRAIPARRFRHRRGRPRPCGRLGVGDAPVVQVAQEARLVDGLRGAEAHGHGGELPEIGHQPGVRVGGDAVALGLLAEIAELRLVDPAFEEGARVDARRRVALEEHQVAAMIGARGMEEMVETDFVEGRRRLEAGNMAAHAGGLLVGAHDAGHRVPADQRLDARFHGDIAGVLVLHVYRDGIHIGGGGVVGQVGARATRLVDELFEQIVGAFRTFLFNDGGEGVEPLARFLRIDVVIEYGHGCGVSGGGGLRPR
jgi:hypothetical protein